MSFSLTTIIPISQKMLEKTHRPVGVSMTWRAMTRSPDCATLQSAHVSNVRLAESNSTPTTTVRLWPSPSPSPPSSNPISQQSLYVCALFVLVLGLVLFLLLLLGFLGIVWERERDRETEKLTKSICIGNCEKWESSLKQWRMEENCTGCGLVVRGKRGQ